MRTSYEACCAYTISRLRISMLRISMLRSMLRKHRKHRKHHNTATPPANRHFTAHCAHYSHYFLPPRAAEEVLRACCTADWEAALRCASMSTNWSFMNSIWSLAG